MGPTRTGFTEAEIRQRGGNLINATVGDLMQRFPSIAKAVDKLPRQDWQDWLDEQGDNASDIIAAMVPIRDE